MLDQPTQLKILNFEKQVNLQSGSWGNVFYMSKLYKFKKYVNKYPKITNTAFQTAVQYVHRR